MSRSRKRRLKTSEPIVMEPDNLPEDGGGRSQSVLVLLPYVRMRKPAVRQEAPA
jgi:hypothetical protein